MAGCTLAHSPSHSLANFSLPNILRSTQKCIGTCPAAVPHGPLDKGSGSRGPLAATRGQLVFLGGGGGRGGWKGGGGVRILTWGQGKTRVS